MTSARALVVGVALCIIPLRPLRAAADPGKAWTAAKASLPATTSVVVGFDLAALAKSSLFKLALPLMLAQQPDMKSGLELVKTTCQIDPLTAVSGVVAGTDKDQKQGAIFIAVNGIDEAKIVTCLDAIAKAKGTADTVVSVTKDGAITEVAKGTDKFYMTWISKDVIAIAVVPGDKAQLQTWTAGKKALAKAPVGASLAKVDTRSAIWAVSSVERDVDGMKMKGGYGGLTSAKGTLTADLHVVLPSADDAKTLADKATSDIAAKVNGPGLDASLKAMLQTVSVKNVGSEVAIRAAIAESSLLSLSGALMAGQ